MATNMTEEVAQDYPRLIDLGGAEVEVRVMSADDRLPVLKFARSLPEQDLLFLRIDITDAGIVDGWVANIKDGATLSIVAYAAEELVGYATVERNPLRWTRRVGEIRVNVAPSFRARGLGRSLTAQIFDIARAMGLKKLVAHMTADQAGAKRRSSASASCRRRCWPTMLKTGTARPTTWSSCPMMWKVIPGRWTIHCGSERPKGLAAVRPNLRDNSGRNAHGLNRNWKLRRPPCPCK